MDSEARSFAALGMALLAALLSGCAYFDEMFDSPKPVIVTELERQPTCGGQTPQPKIHYFGTAAEVNAWEQSRGIPPTPIDAVVEGPFLLIELGEGGAEGNGILISRDAELHFGKRLVLESTFFNGAQVAGRPAEESPCVLLALPPRHYNVIELYDQEGVLRAKTDTKRGILVMKPPAPPSEPAPPQDNEEQKQ